MLVGPEFEPATSCDSADRRSPNWANQLDARLFRDLTLFKVEGFVSSCFASPVSMIISAGCLYPVSMPYVYRHVFSPLFQKIPDGRLKCLRLKSCHMLANDPVGGGSKCLSSVFSFLISCQVNDRLGRFATNVTVKRTNTGRRIFGYVHPRITGMKKHFEIFSVTM